MRAFLALGLAACAPLAAPQAYKPTPVDRCFYLASVRIGPERGSPQLFLHELVEQLGEARAACEQAVRDRPKDGRIHAHLARLRALGGDKAGALESARTGAALGSVNAQVLLGVMLVELRGDYTAAREQFQRAAKQGSPYARFNLGAIFANGWGVQADEPDAAASFGQAAQAGDPLAMQIFGQRYDTAQAERWFRKAAEAMAPEAVREPLRLASLGRAELDGAAMLAWYEGKARGAQPWAQAYVGALHESGQWVKQDYVAAREWYRQAGEAGYVPAQWRMAKFYYEGRGVEKDLAEWRRWSLMQQVQACDAQERAEAGANTCDRLAADRHDPDRVTQGTNSFCMRQSAGRAIAACADAVKQSPATRRYRAQLARAYAHTGRFDEARREAGAAAAAGSTAAMILLGAMSERGLGAEKDGAAAAAWYRKAADAGNARGATFVALQDKKPGYGFAQSAPAPTPQQMAEKGDPRAQFNVAAQLEMEKRYDEAIRWYERAAGRGFRPAELNLAQMYEKGIGVAQDNAEARKRYRRLAGLGDGEARYRAAKLAADAQDYAEALLLYNRSIRDDDYRAMLDVAVMYEEGRGVPKDLRRAVELYERNGERSAWARAKLGVLYLQGGEGLPRDYAKAQRWLARSAGDGNAASRNNLGVMYDRALGVRRDHALALDLYLSALEGGNAQAKGNLESLFAEGRGMPSGLARVAWYRSGADAEIASAQYALGRLYARGEDVQRSDRLAAQWLMKAAQQGHAEARKEAAELFYAMGEDQAAVALGHEGAARRLAEKMAKAGHPNAQAELRRYLADAQQRSPPPPVWPEGVARDPGPDQSRLLAVRVGGVAVAQSVAIDSSLTDVYDIIRWFPESDGKKK